MPIQHNQANSKIIIPYGKQQISEADKQAVLEALESDFLTQGPLVERFESNLASYCGSHYAVVFSSGTAALHAACSVAEIEEGDEVLTSPISFVATSNSILYCRAKPVFADVDPETIQITTNTIEEKISRKTKAIIAVDFAGRAHKLDQLAEFAQSHGLILIEDAAHSLGAQYLTTRDGMQITTRVGSCVDADMACLSFHPVKSITSAEGGAVTTNSEDHYRALIKFRQHGITRQAIDFENGGMGSYSWYHEMQTLGYNYRLSDLHCALGISQLKFIEKKIERRRQIESFYRKHLINVKFLKADSPANFSAHHLVPIQVEGWARDSIFEHLRRSGIGVQLHYIPIYRQPYYRRKFGNPQLAHFPNAEKYFSQAISLPIFPDLTEEQQIKIIDHLNFLVSSQIKSKSTSSPSPEI